jgi:DNA-binding transcriptional MerR regulator
MQGAVEIQQQDDALVSIGDVSKIIGIPTHTIRYWEKEFPQYLDTPRTMGKQRRYGTDQIIRLKKIYSMLKEDGYSIAGARRALANQNRQSNIGSSSSGIDKETAEKIIYLLKEQLFNS